jgi:hypothetical protein
VAKTSNFSGLWQMPILKSVQQPILPFAFAECQRTSNDPSRFETKQTEELLIMSKRKKTSISAIATNK